jgi:hypothetical protein
MTVAFPPLHAYRADLIVWGRVGARELWAGDIGLGRGCLFLLLALSERPQPLKRLGALCG